MLRKGSYISSLQQCMSISIHREWSQNKILYTGMKHIFQTCIDKSEPTFCTEQILFVCIILNTDHWPVTHVNRLNLINLQIVSLLNVDSTLDCIHIVFSLTHKHNSNGRNSQSEWFAAFKITVYIQQYICRSYYCLYNGTEKLSTATGVAVISTTAFWNKNIYWWH